jgi:hypothetical protein
MYKSVANNDAYILEDVDWILLENAIANGIPLPKGHGRLIDADELEELFGKKCVGDCGACMTKRTTDGRGRWYDTCSLIDFAPTIIEADKTGEEE